MPLPNYRLDESHVVVEIEEVVDLDNESVIEQELTRLLPCCGPSTLIVDLRTPLLTPRALGVLLRVRGLAQERGVSVAVVAGHERAREVLSAAGLNRVLRVSLTLQGAESRGRGCRSAPGATPRERQLIRRSVPSEVVRSPGRAVGPYADTSLPRIPKG
ncbi:STAS domain-containing protein [Streptomyces sp. cmx-18-6]|uniref:STAS domain-containing protein n=1 Tax=Streptomyces sp. cmx-18-6 TaxID=2790930 RepID=UPI00397F231E